MFQSTLSSINISGISTTLTCPVRKPHGYCNLYAGADSNLIADAESDDLLRQSHRFVVVTSNRAQHILRPDLQIAGAFVGFGFENGDGVLVRID